MISKLVKIFRLAGLDKPVTEAMEDLVLREKMEQWDVEIDSNDESPKGDQEEDV